MSREQIEGMAKIIGHCESTLHPVIECHNKATGCYCIENPCHNQRIAEALYNAGYRKASEVAREIFAEIHREIELALESNYKARKQRIEGRGGARDGFVSVVDGKIAALRGLADFLDDYLEKKYTEEV